MAETGDTGEGAGVAAAKTRARGRVVRVGEDEGQHFCDNSLVTSKYTALNFLGKNLWEQFQRVANVYFLLIATLQVSGYISPALDLSPTHKLATISPLTLMLILTALKEAIEDYARHAEDHKVNTQRATVLKREGETEIEWRDVRPGMILKVNQDKPFPADMILLRAQTQDATSGKCYVETAELDGETNLKIRNAHSEVLTIAGREEGAFNQNVFLGGEVECDPPNNQLYIFNGTYSNKAGRPIPLDNECILLRGATLRNTEHVYGLVVYTGKETKLAKNMTGGPLKRSNVEQLVDKLIRFIFLALIAVVVTSSVFNLIFQARLHDRHEQHQHEWFYLTFLDKPPQAVDALFAFITFLILFNTFVPISLYVTLETVKVFQAKLIANDYNMYYREMDREMWAQARTSNLHEDLGQIEYIFSDKTGTLTRNEMEFKKAAFAKVLWDTDQSAEGGKSKLVRDTLSGLDAKAAEEFFTLLSLCHTVVPERQDGQAIKYQAESPDEEALVKGAAEAGYVFTEQSTDVDADGGTTELYHVRNVHGEECVVCTNKRKYAILAVNEFTSTRKRMSAVFRRPDGQHVVYAKGADMMMTNDCNVAIPVDAAHHMQDFSVAGLRTLVVARKEIPESFFLDWKQQYDAAKNDIENRVQKLEEAAAILEQDMEYVGITAIEDKLQDGVPDAIASLRFAGLKVWVLTGDKEETAINIGKSCRLLDATMNLHIIRGSEEDKVQPYTLDEISAEIEAIEQKHGLAESEGRKLALVVDGQALGELFRGPSSDEARNDDFSQRQEKARKQLVAHAKNCAAVIGCRVSPKQKRDIVKLVKDNSSPTPMTLAIGDGANDVSMIQEAHIGVGISGNEGMQAVRSADYAIGQFRFLKRLMLVHGRWNYRRVCAVILYSFYKGIAFNLTLFCFGFSNGSSGTTLYDSWLGSGWNVIWTFLPIIFLGALDQDIPAETALADPKLYAVGRDNCDLNRRKMGLFVLTAAAHALTLYGIVYGTFYLSTTVENGTTDGLFIMGTTLNGCLQLTVNLKIVVMSRRLSFWNALVVIGSVASWFIFVIGYSEVFALSQGKFLGIADQLYHRHTFWLLMLVGPVSAILPDLVVTYIQLNYFPEEWDKVRNQPVSDAIPKKPLEQSFRQGEAASLLHEQSASGSGVSAHSSFDYTTAAMLPQHASFEARPDADVHVERHTKAAWKKYVTMDTCHSVERGMEEDHLLDKDPGTSDAD